jgi:hypothetical protein
MVCSGLGELNKFRELGKIVGGDWDLNTMPFEDLNIFQSFNERFRHNVSWENTSYYDSIVAELTQGRNPWGIKDKSGLLNRLHMLDGLFDDIQKYGYVSQREIQHDDFALKNLDEVAVHISRDGEFLFSDGRHRLAIAQILGVPQIPVVVCWRHKDWFQFSEEIHIYAMKHYGGKIYQPITHPDLSLFQSVQGDSIFRAVHKNLPCRNGTLLEAGAHWGYLCHRFEDLSFRCYAVEECPEDYYFLRKLKIAERKRFTVAHADITRIYEKSEYDVVLALNVVSRYFETESGRERLVLFLRRLRTRAIYMQDGSMSSRSGSSANGKRDNHSAVEFVAELTGLTKCRVIGHDASGAPVYMLLRA